MSSKNSFSKKFRLLNKSDFQNLRFGSRFFVSGVLLFYVKTNEFDCSRIGLAVSKKAGKANVRNSFKRAIRELYRCSDYKDLKQDIVIAMNFKKIKKENLNFDQVYELLEESFNGGFKKIANIKPE